MGRKRGQIARNRRLILDLSDILEYAEVVSDAGHPHDIIDHETSTIRLECTMSGKPRVVIEWSGIDKVIRSMVASQNKCPCLLM